MPAEILIVGQGIAGTLLAWEFERAGFSFEVADSDTGHSASLLAAGMINPITGMRFVKSWKFESFMASARSAYRELEEALGISVWKNMRIRRLFRGDDERGAFEAKWAKGEFGAFVRDADSVGFWIEGAARVDTALLLGAMRAHLRKRGRFRAERVDVASEARRHSLVVDCSGKSVGEGSLFARLPWRPSKGELLRIAVEGLDPGTIMNRGHWVLPTVPGQAIVGATHEADFVEAGPTPAGRALLEKAASDILIRPFTVVGHEAAVRIGLSDRLPVVGRHWDDPGVGILSGLGNKGILTAPGLARQWMNHVSEGVPFDPGVHLARFSVS